jgi:ubiquinone/menaquinone biosynthesis C-methylase UbiE
MREGPNVDIVAFANNLPFYDEEFDNVLCLEMLEHDNRFWESIKEMYRVLKPGGTMVITTRSNGFPNHDYPYDYYRFSKEALIDLFNMVNLKNIRVEDDSQVPGVLGCGVK